MKKPLALLAVLAMVVPLAAETALAGEWERLWGPVGMVVQDSKSRLYVTKLPEGDVYVLSSPAGQIGGPGRKFVTDSDTLYSLSPDGSGVWQYTGVPKKWRQIGGPARDIYGGRPGLFATDPQTGDLYAYELFEGGKGTRKRGWTRIGGPGRMFAVGGMIGTGASAKCYLYGLAPDGQEVRQFNFSTMEWKRIGGAAGAIYAGGDEVYATNPGTGDLWQYKRETGEWIKIGGPGRMFVIDSVEGTPYALAPDGGSVWKYNGKPMEWEEIGGPAGCIYMGLPFGKFYATNPQTNELYYYAQYHLHALF